MFKVEILSNGFLKTEYAEEGNKLSDVLLDSGVNIEHPCGFNGVCRKCSVVVNGKAELSCRYTIKSDIVVEVNSEKIISSSGIDETNVLRDNVCLTLDIGTTTLALAVVNADDCSVYKVLTDANPQRTFGADVISRIKYCTDNGPDKLQSAVVDTIKQMINKARKCTGISFFPRMFVAGNTTMLHLLLGVDCSSIGVSPYTSAFLDARQLTGSSLGLNCVGEIFTLPCISSFVGADIVAGLAFVGKPQEGKYRLLLDLGTNTEIALMSNDSILCTSAAAGPCFEGVNISCGMTASDGAVSAYHHDGSYDVIGNCAPRGVCATGLFDIISVLLSNGIIDSTGRLSCTEYEIVPGVLIKAEDIRNFQTAKAAVCAGIMTLLRSADVSFDKIECFCVSGGFSTALNVESAVTTGLFPCELKDKFISVNNSCLKGLVKCCRDIELPEQFSKGKYLDLSADGSFFDNFVSCMLFE